MVTYLPGKVGMEGQWSSPGGKLELRRGRRPYTCYNDTQQRSQPRINLREPSTYMMLHAPDRTQHIEQLLR
jgi:hypothetical protein